MVLDLLYRFTEMMLLILSFSYFRFFLPDYCFVESLFNSYYAVKPKCFVCWVQKKSENIFVYLFLGRKGTCYSHQLRYVPSPSKLSPQFVRWIFIKSTSLNMTSWSSELCTTELICELKRSWQPSKRLEKDQIIPPV